MMPRASLMTHLRTLSRDVTGPATGPTVMSPRAVACALSGVIRMVVRRHGTARMRQACAGLCVSWPGGADHGREVMPVDFEEAESPIMAACEGLRALAGDAGIRSALAFWAVETDAAVWRDVAAAA